MDLYFERHDGQAVTCDDFRAAMADANGFDLEQFEAWYTQAGTPILEVQENFDAGSKTYSLQLKQVTPQGQDASRFRPLQIPLRIGLLGEDGTALALQLDGEPAPGGSERVIELRKTESELKFVGIAERPVASLLRGYSAPVNLSFERSPRDLAFLMAHDTDTFVRWDAGQTLFGDAILALAADAAACRDLSLGVHLVEAFRAVLVDPELDGSMRALMLVLPSETVLEQRMAVIDPDSLFTARTFVQRGLAEACLQELQALLARTANTGPYAATKEAIDRRRLRGTVLAYFSKADEAGAAQIAADELAGADNMTDTMSSLGCLVQMDVPQRAQALEEFYARWRQDPLVLDKWFTLQACSRLPGAAERVLELSQHPDFQLQNPNRARSLVGAFSRANPTGFHTASGVGYRFLADQVMALDPANPQVAARLVGAFQAWKRYDSGRQALMRTELERIQAQEGLSKNVSEIVARALA